jgi:Domain of Unknown Function (DUF1080)
MSKNAGIITVLTLASAVILVMGGSGLADESGWVPLFDGKTLDGWKVNGGTASYKVEGGVIVGTTVEGSPNTFLCKGDFVLELKPEEEVSSSKPPEGFKAVFNGHDLTGWEGSPAYWSVEDEKRRKLDGVLAVQVHVGPPMTIRYKDFFLRELPNNLPLITPDQAPVPPDTQQVAPQGQDKPRKPDAD